MTDREKLVELISDARINGHRVDDLFYHDFAEDIADHLLANGVTVQQWRDAKTDPPNSGEHVLLCCEIKPTGSRYVCDGYYAAKHTEIASSCGDDIACEYSEEDDEYYLLEGWYEVIKNWDDYNSIVVADFVVGWMPLPETLKEVPHEKH